MFDIIIITVVVSAVASIFLMAIIANTVKDHESCRVEDGDHDTND